MRRVGLRYRYMPSQSAIELRRKRRLKDARRVEFDRQSLEEVLSVLARWSSGTGSRDAAARCPGIEHQQPVDVDLPASGHGGRHFRHRLSEVQHLKGLGELAQA